MPKQSLMIKEVYVGSIDAKDEIVSQEGVNKFINCFIIPNNFNLEEIIEGHKYFIEGYKGTGKTALLQYIGNKVQQEKNAFTSLFLFKTQYKEHDRKKIENLAKNLYSIDEKSMLEELEFEGIWKWILLKKIVDDNVESGYSIFSKDSTWNKFEQIMKRLSKEKNSKSIFDWLPFKIGSIGSRITMDNGSDIEFIQTIGIHDIEVKRNKLGKKEISIEFDKLLDKAEELFLNLVPTGRPYYMLVDELDVFYEDKELFKRDLRMIRDIILTIKHINTLSRQCKNNVLIICGVRTEVLQSIKSFISQKELNKAIFSFKAPLKWNYTNTNSYRHPIFQIWLKRILMSEKQYGNIDLTDKEVLDKWFCQKVDGTSIVKYILDRTWNKPRDIVRFLQVISNSMFASDTKYGEKIFSEIKKDYSKASWEELVEELNIIYTPKEIESIRDFLVGFYPQFSYEEAEQRVEDKKDDFLRENLRQICDDLYRIGVLGNRTLEGSYRWNHKGDERIIIDNNQIQIYVHQGLWNELSLNIGNKKIPISGEQVECEVVKVIPSHVFVKISGFKIPGSIYIGEMSDEYINDLKDEVKIGDKFEARVLGFDNVRKKINLSRKNSDYK